MNNCILHFRNHSEQHEIKVYPRKRTIYVCLRAKEYLDSYFSLTFVASISVKKINNRWVFSDGVDHSAVAWGTLTISMNVTGL